MEEQPHMIDWQKSVDQTVHWRYTAGSDSLSGVGILSGLPGLWCRMTTSIPHDRWFLWPGFWNESSQRERISTDQRSEDDQHASTKTAYHPRACVFPSPFSGNMSFWQDIQAAGRPRRIRFPTDTDHPQRRQCDMQPHSFGSCWIGHFRLLPMPAAPFAGFEAMLDPGPHALPRGIRHIRRQIREHNPRIGLPVIPARHDGAWKLGVFRRETGGRSVPGSTRSGNK